MRLGAGSWLALAVGLPFAGCSFPAYVVEEQLADAGQPSVDGNEPPPGACVDGKQSAKETGLDCGGLCPPCSAGQGCLVGQDCESGNCVDTICQLARCDDGLRNGDEAEVDCGGTCDARCDVGMRCLSAQDCASSVCSDTCQAASCTDQVRNGSETAVDCGGPCQPCAEGQACSKASDCVSGNCSSLICVSVSCTNGSADGTETDVDCGGGCAPCVAGASCSKAADCESGICQSNRQCSEATCTDKLQNGSETDSDCGGICPGCASNQACTGGADCSSGLCNNGFCVPAMETGAQVGPSGFQATASLNSDMCSAAFDGSTFLRWSTGTNQRPSMWFTLDLGEPQIFFKIVLRAYDTSYSQPDDGPALFDLYESLDGNFTNPAKQNLPGGPMTTIHFDSAQRARYIHFSLTGAKEKWWSINELSVYQ